MFTHLHVHSNFSFLDGGSSVRALIDRAKEVGCDSLAVTDHNGLYGAVRFYGYAKEVGVKPIIGVEMNMEDGGHVVLIAKNLDGYSNLCKIVTKAQLSHEKGSAAASLDILSNHKDHLFCLSGCMKGIASSFLVENEDTGLHARPEAAENAARSYLEIFGSDNFFIEMQNHLLPGNHLLNSRLHDLAAKLGVRTVATNNAHYAKKEDFKVQDLLACVQTTTKLDDRHPIRKTNCEYYLKSPAAMSRLFARYPEAVAATSEIAAECNLDLGLGRYRFPTFPVPAGETPYSYLCKLCFEGLEQLYKPITPKVMKRLQYELSVIHDMGFAEYFIVVWDIVRYARENGIRCSGRGSAADSLVAYCLRITIADPIEHDLLFERFLNPERKGMPDIDIDFDSLRRDEVIDYVYKRHGEDKVAMVCTVSTLLARSAVRDLGKAMDFPPVEIDCLASALPHTGASRIRQSMETLPELRDSKIPINKMEALLDICEKVDGFPRHLSVHLGGLVISGGPLTDLVPLEWATKGIIVSQYDKDDIETLGLVKMDLLGLKNLSAIEEALATIKAVHGIEVDIDNMPRDDPEVYRMLRTTDTVGLFQLESPGMRGLLGRLQPDCFEDIIAQISLFRPGPMQADMINPFIKRRHGIEQITYVHPSLEAVLGDTYGVILYQEQVLKVANAIAGFTYGQSDSLRRAMTKNRTQEEMEKIKETFIAGATARGVESEVAEDVFSKLRAFAAYGFCKAHAASFARITYHTSWLKTHYPAEFLAGILSCQPMGFYPSNVIVEEARRMGIGILSVDVNRSLKKFSVEDGAIRIGLMQVKGISESEIDSILEARDQREFTSIADFCRRAQVDRPTIENLIACGAFGPGRRKLLWMLGEILESGGKARKGHRLDQTSQTGRTGRMDSESPLFDEDDFDERFARLPDIPDPPEHVLVRMDYDILGMSSLSHPMTFYRDTLRRMGIKQNIRLREAPNKSVFRAAGVVVVCMRPPTKSGIIVVFITLEDETGLADVVVFPKVYEQYGHVIFNSAGLIIEGKAERSGSGVSLIAEKILPLTSKYRNTDLAPDSESYKERVRTAGQRSWVKGQGV
jgi:error-prone DNA polymerase